MTKLESMQRMVEHAERKLREATAAGKNPQRIDHLTRMLESKREKLREASISEAQRGISAAQRDSRRAAMAPVALRTISEPTAVGYEELP